MFVKTNFSTRHLILVCQKLIKVRRVCFTPSRCSALSGPSASVAPWLYVTGVAMHLDIEEYPNTKRDVYYPPCRWLLWNGSIINSWASGWAWWSCGGTCKIPSEFKGVLSATWYHQSLQTTPGFTCMKKIQLCNYITSTRYNAVYFSLVFKDWPQIRLSFGEGPSPCLSHH